MEREKDWKVPAALILAGLALLVALGGRNMAPFANDAQPQGKTVIISGTQNGQPNVVIGKGDGGGTVVIPAPADPSTQPSAPGAPYLPSMVKPSLGFRNGFGSGFGHGFFLFPFLGIGLILLLVFLLRRRRWHPGYPGYPSYGRGAWQAPWQGQQPPYGQGQAQGQPYGTAPQPGQGPGHWEWHPDTNVPPPPTNHGDITQPGQGNQ